MLEMYSSDHAVPVLMKDEQRLPILVKKSPGLNVVFITPTRSFLEETIQVAQTAAEKDKIIS